VCVLLVVGYLLVASMLAGDKYIVNDTLHDVAMLDTGAVTIWEFVGARRAYGVPLRTLKHIIYS
jgi:hypothetical protein